MLFWLSRKFFAKTSLIIIFVLFWELSRWIHKLDLMFSAGYSCWLSDPSKLRLKQFVVKPFQLTDFADRTDPATALATEWPAGTQLKNAMVKILRQGLLDNMPEDGKTQSQI